MRLFQFHSFYRPYLDHFYKAERNSLDLGYQAHLQCLLGARFHSVHILEPIYTRPESAAFAVANDMVLQRKWAAEKGLKFRSPTDILLAQIEEHRAEVLYSLDPVGFGAEFINRLPGCVKKTLCWFAAPGDAPGVHAYRIRMCNFNNFISKWRAAGARSEWFSPAVDPLMDSLATTSCADRPIDVAFAGLYSRHHSGRNAMLESIAQGLDGYRIQFAFQAPKWRPVSNIRILNRIPTGIPYIPKALRRVSSGPVYGIDLYKLFASSKIVINAAVDVAGNERGNMRCFEAMGCGALMLSDSGTYPPDFLPGQHFVIYHNLDEVIKLIRQMLADLKHLGEVASAGRQFMSRNYSRAKQWARFVEIVDSI